MFLLNIDNNISLELEKQFTIQNVPIKSKKYKRFKIIDRDLQYKMFLLNCNFFTIN